MAAEENKLTEFTSTMDVHTVWYAERALLGSILVSPEYIAEIRKKVKVSHFLDADRQDNQHARIYEAMLVCEHPDQISVAREMAKRGTIQPGDPAYMSNLIAEVTCPFDYPYYIKAMLAEEPEEEPEVSAPVIVEFPEEAWQGLFADYRDLMAETTEAADAFHFATFCQIMGATIGRQLFVYHATTLYPNFYICLVGKTGLTRKDTCMARARDILNRLHAENTDENPRFRVIRGIRSYEGLLDELEGEGKVRLIQVGELLSLLAKAKQESLSNIIPQLTELYDCPERVNPPVHHATVDCKKPFVSIIAGTTHEWLRKALTDREIYGGFANRWMYFSGMPKPPKSNPPRIDYKKRDALLSAINTIRSWAEDAASEGELIISQEAESMFTEYYNDYYDRCQHEGIIPSLIVRIQDFVWKLAVLYAAIDLSDVIKEQHIRPAISVGHYLELSVSEVFRSFTDSKEKQLEMKILNYLRGAEKPMDYRIVYKNLNMSAKELDACVEPLIRLGIIRNSFRPGKKKNIRMLEA